MGDRFLNTLYSPLPMDAIAGAASGFLIGTLLQPLEIVKVCLIVNPMQLASIDKASFATSFATSVRMIYQMEGFKGFWRGLTPALMRIACGSAVYFQTLHKLSSKFKKNGFTGTYSDFTSSGLARTLSSFACNPLTIIRTRFEVVGFKEYTNTWDAVKKINKKEGVKGFYKGSVACMMRDGPFAGLYYSILNISKKRLQHLNLNPSTNTMISGMVAGIIATTMTHPFEVLRTRIQVDHPDKGYNYKYNYCGVFQGLRLIYSQEGLSGLSKGLTPRLMRKPLANALTFTMFERFKGQQSKNL